MLAGKWQEGLTRPVQFGYFLRVILGTVDIPRFLSEREASVSEPIGQSLQLPPGRRVICDLMDASARAPTVTIQKDVHLAEVVAARNLASPRPSWCGIFTKAYASVVANRPELRRAFLSFPWERLFEYHQTSADIVAEARVGDETVVVGVPLKRPEALPLLEIDRKLAWHLERPIERLRTYRRALGLARLPPFLRRWVWWYLLNVSGRKRARYFAAFCVSSVGHLGVDLLNPLTPLTSLLHYGAIEPTGKVSLRLTFDHRVLDGAAAARALNETEEILKTAILAELHALSRSLAA